MTATQNPAATVIWQQMLRPSRDPTYPISDPARRCAAPATPSWPADFAGLEQDSTARGKGTQPEKSPTNKPL